MVDKFSPAPSPEILQTPYDIHPALLTITSTSTSITITIPSIPNPSPQPPKAYTSFILHDPLSPYPMLCIHAYDHGRDGYENRGKGRASRDHEDDDHLQLRSLMDGGATQDGACHHTWNGDYSEDAGGVGRVISCVFDTQ
jgi:hypothetical protein